MKARLFVIFVSLTALVLADATAKIVTRKKGQSARHDRSMPYAKLGLTDRQAAAHLIDRFTFGPTPGLIDAVVDEGLENWFARQLERSASSNELEAKLSRLETLALDNEEILRDFPRPGRVRREAIDEGKIDPDASRDEQRRALRAYYEEKGYKRQSQLLGELVAQKLLRAVHSPNQVEEVMVDFWFNHFYVSATDNQCRRFVGTYERDAIRPYVFASFGGMLEATARHPAMLLYLDNAQSSAPEGASTTVGHNKNRLRGTAGGDGSRYDAVFDRMEAAEERRRMRMAEQSPQQGQRRRGINENYARELMELHTLGVDGGYTQEDVVAVARAFTGWTVLPEGRRREKIRNRASSPLARQLGYVIDGDFFFNADWHDAGGKHILGREFPLGGGLEEGREVLDVLASHPATARHIAGKLAVRFVSDDPPERCVETLAEEFDRTGGDMRALLWQIVRCEEFWEPAARTAKVKTPFELAASSLRVLGADVRNPRQLSGWVDRMGQPLYRYQAPTGFPDKAENWVNAGALLHRMNFGITLAAGRVRGVRVELTSFDPAGGGREPESADAALEAYAAAMLPERDLEETLAALRPLVGRPDVTRQIEERSDAQSESSEKGAAASEDDMVEELLRDGEPGEFVNEPRSDPQDDIARLTLAQVVGLILGSPEFQRR